MNLLTYLLSIYIGQDTFLDTRVTEIKKLMELIFGGPDVSVNNSYEECENMSKNKTAAYCNELKYIILSSYLQTILVVLGHK